jgi:hypothetical protein
MAGGCRRCGNKHGSGDLVDAKDIVTKFQALNKRIKDSPPGSSEQAKAVKAIQGDVLINACLFLYAEHPSYSRRSPCLKCWLPCELNHVCIDDSNPVRACLMYVWHVKRTEFLGIMRAAGHMQYDVTSWNTFLEWSLYNGTISLSNVYRVIDFVIGQPN